MRRLGEIERYTCIPYDESSFDCADLVMLVQRDLFGRCITLPGARPRGEPGQAQLGALSKGFARPRNAPPQDGDLVLMFDHAQRRPGHAGVYFYLSHEGWVLHGNERAGCSVLERVRDLPAMGLRIEGYYEWV